MSDQENARKQAIAQFNSIRELVENLEAARNLPIPRYSPAVEYAERAIHESALSVEVRSDWYTPGDRDADSKPAEYHILLCTGGPAVQLVGTLSEHGEPETARLEYQDWFTPWERLRASEISPSVSYLEHEQVLLAYASCFYFGE